MLPEAELLAEREQVLSSHRAGSAVDIGDALRYQRALADRRRFHVATAHALDTHTTLLQPRAGVATTSDQIALLRHLGEHGADVLPLTVDSYTRQLDFERADRRWQAAESAGDARALNGFPVVSAGVTACRSIVEACDRPVQVRHGSPDGRLLAEVSFAGGFTAFEGGAITYCIPYSRDVTLEQSLRHWRYVDRLCGLYSSAGVVIEREAFGALTGILIPPAIAIACSVLELLLAAAEGVSAFALGIGQGGDLVQDTAAIQALGALGAEYLSCCQPRRRVRISTVLYQWMGPFPEDEARAAGVIALGAVTAAAARPTRMITKTQQEAHGVPDARANAAGLRLTRTLLAALAGRPFVDERAVREERYWIEREARCLLDGVLGEVGERSLDEAIVAAFASGRLDVPFAPSRAVAGRVWPARDRRRAIRFADFGGLPLDAEARARNDRELRGSPRREQADPQVAELLQIVQDLNFADRPADHRGLPSAPLDDHKPDKQPVS